MPPPDSRESRIFGAALMAVGGLMAGLCGACTLMSWYVIVAFETRGDLQGLISSAGIPLLMGGIPTVVGALLFRAGLRRHRVVPRPPPSSSPPRW